MIEAQNRINEKWMKAAVLGTIWAAFEIVLGSFLHNLQLPFSGNVLTGIAIILLISVSYVWNEKGLFWRAGLICALLKTLSPSALIFGPMIAIFIESMLLEVSVRFVGRNYLGFALGALLAMLWNLFHKIANYVIFYGLNIIEIYEKLMKYAQKQLNIPFDLVWTPLVMLVIIYLLLGLLAAIIGMKAGKQFLKNRTLNTPVIFHSPGSTTQLEKHDAFHYSRIWLFANVILMIGSLALLNFTPWWVWSLTITAVVVCWSFRYKRALQQLSRPKFWIFFVVLTMLIALVFAKIQDHTLPFAQALLIGIQMNFRAIVMLVGFSALGTELYNPVIRAFFVKTSFRNLPLAMEISLGSLPLMIAQIPELKSIFKNPTSVVFRMIMLAEQRFSELKKQQFIQQVFILTGDQGEGKTTCLLGVVKFLKEHEIAIGGIISPRIIENNETTGYDIMDIATNESAVFLRLADIHQPATIGKYSMITAGLKFGCHALNPTTNRMNSLVMIDEVGKLELHDLGWALCIQKLIEANQQHLLLVIRKNFVESVLQKWKLNPNFVYNISQLDCHTIGYQIMDKTLIK